jgi:hypothetical protein
VHAGLDDLVIALYVTIDELLEPRRGPGRPPKFSDAELLCLAVAQVLLGYRSERRWLRAVTGRLGHLFPYVCGQATYNRRLRRAAPLVAEILHAVAVACPSWCDQWRPLDATPVPCGVPRGRPCGARPWPAGPAMGMTAATAAGSGGSSCTCWPARTACRPPGAWPTRSLASGRSPRACWTGPPASASCGQAWSSWPTRARPAARSSRSWLRWAPGWCGPTGR